MTTFFVWSTHILEANVEIVQFKDIQRFLRNETIVTSNNDAIDTLCIEIEPLQTFRTDTDDKPRRLRSERTLIKSCENYRII